MKIRTLFACSLMLSAMMGKVYAITYQLPEASGDRVVASSEGDTASITVDHDQTLLDVARQFNLGQTEIVTLNPKLDRWLIKKGTVVRLPNKRILPDTPHQGITLNIAEYRMYYYPAEQPGTVRSYAHGIGRQDWKTPLGKTSVARKVKDPAWHPPESIRREHAAMGDPLPAIVPPGPNNPLGAYALHLNLPGEYRIHGTDVDKIYGIGMQITHGCVRMYPEDIEALYNSVSIGTPVYIVKQPIKVGWLNNVLYIEAHPDLEGEEKTQDERYALALDLIQKANNGELPEFDQVALNKTLKELDGTPLALYERLPPLEEVIPATDPEPVPEPVAKSPKPVPVAVAKSKKSTLAFVTTSSKSGSVTASKSKKQVSATAIKYKEQVSAITNKGKKQESVTASKSKKKIPATASKTRKQEPTAASKTKKQEPATASKSKKQEPTAVSKTRKQEPATASKTKKQGSVTVSKTRKQEPASASKRKKLATKSASKTQSQSSTSGYYRGT